MPVEWQFEKNNLVVFRVSGELGIDEYQKAQGDMEASIKKLGVVKMLIILDGFTGWEHVDGWEDVSFVERNDPFIEKMAIVGDEQWRDRASAFTLMGMRPVPIEYFNSDAEPEARQWLDNESQ